LLFYLEQLLGGPAVFEPYVKAHVHKFAHHSISTADWFQFLQSYFAEHHPEKIALLDTVDWDSWFFGPGLVWVFSLLFFFNLFFSIATGQKHV